MHGPEHTSEQLPSRPVIWEYKFNWDSKNQATVVNATYEVSIQLPVGAMEPPEPRPTELANLEALNSPEPMR
jgi:hypothetical protein